MKIVEHRKEKEITIIDSEILDTDQMKINAEIEKIKYEQPEKYNEIKKKSRKDKFIGIAFITWFIASIGLMLYFSQKGQVALIISVFGHYFSVFGLLAIISRKKDFNFKEDFPSVLFMLLGLIIMIVGMILQYVIK